MRVWALVLFQVWLGCTPACPLRSRRAIFGPRLYGMQLQDNPSSQYIQLRLIEFIPDSIYTGQDNGVVWYFLNRMLWRQVWLQRSPNHAQSVMWRFRRTKLAFTWPVWSVNISFVGSARYMSSEAWYDDTHAQISEHEIISERIDYARLKYLVNQSLEAKLEWPWGRLLGLQKIQRTKTEGESLDGTTGNVWTYNRGEMFACLVINFLKPVPRLLAGNHCQSAAIAEV